MSPLDELLHVVGEEREKHSPEEVAKAQKRLIRLLGGTRRQCASRARSAGTLSIVAGACILVLGVLVLLAGFGVVPFGPGDVHPAEGILGFALASSAGALLLLCGIAILTGRRPGGRLGRLIWWVSRHAADVYRSGPGPEDVVAVVGAGRASHSKEEVGAAIERIEELWRRHLQGVRRTMRVAAGLGAYAGLVDLVVSVLLLRRWLMGEPGPFLHYPELPEAAPHAVRTAWVLAARALLVVFVGTMPVLGIGGAGLLFCRDWGRKLTAGVLWLWAALAVLLATAELVALPFAGPERLTFVGLALSAFIGALVYGALARSLHSPTILEICGA